MGDFILSQMMSSSFLSQQHGTLRTVPHLETLPSSDFCTYSLGFCNSSRATSGSTSVLFLAFLSSFFSVIALTPSLGFNPGIFKDAPQPLSPGQLLSWCQTHVANSTGCLFHRRPSTTPPPLAFTFGFPNRPGLLWWLGW